ncbi:hypothetical protein T12_6116 [Trichinella patagoniensis]|uniref:Uncharacterized protein n=1 Tax=Trichinella patagoniensis TaxID=990121 RepID=A0A0V0ZVS5_9BILA|nr:hypothetical protein T12_6116 [Trichinella patagoniensis]
MYTHLEIPPEVQTVPPSTCVWNLKTIDHLVTWQQPLWFEIESAPDGIDGSINLGSLGENNPNGIRCAVIVDDVLVGQAEVAPVKPHVGFRVCSTSSGGATVSALLFCSEALHQKDHSMVPESFMLSFLSAGTSRP